MCSQHGLRTGSCLTVGKTFSVLFLCRILALFYFRQACIARSKAPRATSLRQRHQRAVALFCLEATIQQAKQGRHFVLVHHEKSTLWTLPTAKMLESIPGAPWGRVSTCSDWPVTSNVCPRATRTSSLPSPHHNTKRADSMVTIFEGFISRPCRSVRWHPR